VSTETNPALGATLTFDPAASQAKVSGPVVVALQGNNFTDLAAVLIKIKWDPKILRLNQVTPAALLTHDGNISPPSLDIRNDAGEASIEMTRTKDAPGVNGTGALMQFTFTAVGKGASAIAIAAVSPKDSKQQVIAVTAPTAVVMVQ